MTTTLAPSPWIQRFTPLIRQGGSILDLACGSGRHARYLAAQGFQVTGIDRDTSQCPAMNGLTLITADLEDGSAWPLGQQQFDAIIVTNYLWRPIFPDLCAAIAAGGLLLYETFAAGQEHFGRPKNPQFLLQRGELLRLTTPLRPVAFEDGILNGQKVVQRLCAIRADHPAPLPNPN